MTDIESIYDWPEEEMIPRLKAVIEGQGLSMMAMGKELRESRAEVATLREKNYFFQAQYQDEAGINQLRESLEFAKAEIARLTLNRASSR